MTLIEFFDEEKIDNAIGTLLLQPVRTIFLCPKEKDISFLNALNKILERRGISTHLLMEQVDVTDGRKTTEQVERLINKYPDVDFDIAGGNEVMLVTMGELAKKYSLPMHMANAQMGTITPINSNKEYKTYKVALTVEELISIHGGKCSKDAREKETYLWRRDSKAEEEILKVWKVCKSDVGAWNSAIGAMRGYNMDKKNVLAMIWSKLKREGLVYKDQSTVRYKSELVKYLLQKQGNALEMYTYTMAKRAGIFDDGQSGAVIDWKGRREVENEIDVLLTKGAVGYFISCKNGIVDSDELYKLSIVAKRFGGKYAKKILVLSRFEPDMSFMNRAEELNITVIKNARAISEKEFIRRLSQA